MDGYYYVEYLSCIMIFSSNVKLKTTLEYDSFFGPIQDTQKKSPYLFKAGGNLHRY